MAPEVLTEETYSEKADVYSFGLILWELVNKKMPFENVPPYGIPVQVTKGNVIAKFFSLVGIRPPIPPECNTEYSKLIRICWQTK